MAKRRKKTNTLGKEGADMRSQEDALGSYTGVAFGDCYEKPIQDADDL